MSYDPPAWADKRSYDAGYDDAREAAQGAAPPPSRANDKPPRRFQCPDCPEWFWFRTDLSKHREGIHPEAAAPRAEGLPRRTAGDGGPDTDDWTCSCGLTRPATGSYGCVDCGDGRPDSWERISSEGFAPQGAEWLDVERLAEGYCRATHYYEQHTGKPTRQCPLWEQHVETMRDTLARCRPSDDPVPESEEPR